MSKSKTHLAIALPIAAVKDAAAVTAEIAAAAPRVVAGVGSTLLFLRPAHTHTPVEVSDGQITCTRCHKHLTVVDDTARWVA